MVLPALAEMDVSFLTQCGHDLVHHEAAMSLMTSNCS
jgi:hypothetical protein